uniref:hypothetical protein n=1 Tax=Spongiimicrobium sp. 3-5 TaxID=3332596 RepID=UPI0039817E09
PQWQDAAALGTNLGADVTSTDGSITGVANDAALAAMDLQVNVDGNTLEVDPANGVQIADDGVTTTQIGTAGIADANRVLGTDAAGDPQWQIPDVMAMGKVNALATPLGTRTNGATAVLNSPGNYTVTLNPVNATADYVIQLTLLNAGPGFSIEVDNQLTTGFDVLIYNDANVPTNASWYFTVTDF